MQRRSLGVIFISTLWRGARIVALALSGIAVSSALAATPVTSCGTVIDTSGDYVLAQDLMCSGGDAIQVTGSLVRLELAGHHIFCAVCDGISVNPNGVLTDIRSVLILGPGLISGSATGVHIFGVLSAAVIGVAFDNDIVGLRVETDSAGNPSSSGEFAANVATDCGIGFYDPGGDSNRYIGNSATETGGTITGGYGIAILSNNNTITGNAISRDYTGILVQNANGNRLEGNRVTNNLVSGITVDGTSSGNGIVFNSVTGNGILDLQGDCTANRFAYNAFITASSACIH